MGCSESTIRRMIRDGLLPAFPLRPGRPHSGLRIPVESLTSLERRSAAHYADWNGNILVQE